MIFKQNITIKFLQLSIPYYYLIIVITTLIFCVSVICAWAKYFQVFSDPNPSLFDKQLAKKNKTTFAINTKNNNNNNDIHGKEICNATLELERLKYAFPLHIYNTLSYSDSNNNDPIMTLDKLSLFFDEIDHPGMLLSQQQQQNETALTNNNDKQPTIVKLQVPKFWNPKVYDYINAKNNNITNNYASGGNGGIRYFLGQHGQRTMTSQEAATVGSYDSQGRKTIFVAIASYRDPECTPTIEDLLLRAKYPQRIRVAVVDQLTENDVPCGVCSNSNNATINGTKEDSICHFQHLIDRFELPAHLSIGPLFARHISHRMYRGEYFTLQIDAHTRFTPGWDQSIIQQWKSTNNEMAVISTYPYDIKYIHPETHQRLISARAVMCKTYFEDEGVLRHLRHGAQPSLYAKDGKPTLHAFWAAGFSFSRGHFFVQVPYDQYGAMVFMGSEPNIAIRAFTYGYDFYTVGIPIAFHMYKQGVMKTERDKVAKFTENKQLYPGAAEAGMQRITSIIGLGYSKQPEYIHNDEAQYGLGQVRSIHQFFKIHGIDPVSRKMYGDQCTFVTKKMHKKFIPFLRADKMGIDYSLIHHVMPNKK